MRAAKQGAFDAFCGLYAVVNAVELVGVTGRRSALHRDLFHKLALGLTPHELRRAVMCGLEAEEIIAASRKAFRWLRREHDIDLRIGRPFVDRDFADTADFLRALRLLTADQPRAIIFGVALPDGTHWTVVSGWQGRWLTVRDSGRLRRLDLTRFKLRGGRHRFLVEETIVIRRRN